MQRNPHIVDVAKQTRHELETPIAKHGALAMVWRDLLAKLRQTDPALFQHQAALA